MSTTATRNLAVLAERSAARRRDRDVLLYEDRWYRSSELLERSRRIAAALSELGVAPGDRVVVSMANCPEVGISYNAIWRAGAVMTPAMFLLAAADLRHVISNSEARAVITTPEFAGKVLDAVHGLSHVAAVICAGDAPEGVVALAELESAEPGAIVPRDDEDLAALLYTGGTTGRSKGVMLTHASLHYTGGAAHDAAHVPGVNRALMTLPLSHAYGLLVTIASMHSDEEDGFSVLLRWFDPGAFLRLIGEHGIQLSAVVPSMLQILLSQPLEDFDLSSLRFLSSGGAPLAAEIEAEFCRRVPGVAIRQGYGLTETAALISTNPLGQERPGSVGRPVPGAEVRVLDDAGRELSAGEVGEICARSPGIMEGYWRSPEVTAEALVDGWLHTGDLGYLDEDGFLFIVDRKKDLIIRGGFNVYPRDIEDALLEHPQVELAGVVGRPDPRHGEEVVAFVSLREGSSSSGDELASWARERIGGYKYPREIHVVAAVPLTPVGKIDRKALRVLLPDA